MPLVAVGGNELTVVSRANRSRTSSMVEPVSASDFSAVIEGLQKVLVSMV